MSFGRDGFPRGATESNFVEEGVAVQTGRRGGEVRLGRRYMVAGFCCSRGGLKFLTKTSLEIRRVGGNRHIKRRGGEGTCGGEVKGNNYGTPFVSIGGEREHVRIIFAAVEQAANERRCSRGRS